MHARGRIANQFRQCAVLMGEAVICLDCPLSTRTTIMQRVLRAPIFWISVAVVAAAVVIFALTMGGGAAGGGVGY
jgi:hypothetical protein